jgi:hypothetical protein
MISADNTNRFLCLRSAIECLTILKTCGSLKDQNSWKIRTNDEIQVMYRKLNIVTKVKVRRPELAGRPERCLMTGP